jgi:outer membrane protein assembly factor BamB
LSLDASTGKFEGFFSPPASDSYRPNDTDVDVCGSPAIFTNAGKTVIAIGSKSGAFWLLDASNVNNVLARRQLLPYDSSTSAPLPNVDPHSGPGENKYGVFGTPAIHFGLGRLFVGIGGYAGIDTQTTPFMRAVDWNSLDDAWATHVVAVGSNHVSKYVVPQPPMYTTSEAGCGSPAVVNDVVLVATAKPGLYGLCAHTGFALWSATGLAGSGFILGPAIYGNYVVVGTGSQVNIYSL